MNFFDRLAHPMNDDLAGRVMPQVRARFAPGVGEVTEAESVSAPLFPKPARQERQEVAGEKGRPGDRETGRPGDRETGRLGDKERGSGREGERGSVAAVVVNAQFVGGWEAGEQSGQSAYVRTADAPAAPTAQQMATVRPVVQQPAVVQPRIVVRLPATRSPATTQQVQQTPAAPTIRISIGRVEVRAVVKQEPPVREAAKARPQDNSLENYLRGKGRKP